MNDENLFHGRLVKLAAPQPADQETVSRWFDDPEFQRLMSTRPAIPKSPEDIKADDEKYKTDHDNYHFRIRTLEDDRLIGFVSLNGIEWNNGVAGLGIGIGDRDFWGKGYGSDAVEVVLRFAFDELNLYRIHLDVFAYNERAVAAYEKAGFVREGRTRGALLRDGQRHDDIMMGILRPEWEARHPRD